MPNPWAILAIGLAWLASLVGVGYWQREDGRLAERVAWTKRDNDALTAANEKIESLNNAAREREAQHAAQMDAIGTWLAKENQDAEARTRRAVDNARALVLRKQPACPNPGGGAPAETSAPASGSDGQAACELPSATVRDLFRLVGDADSAVRQLAACQAVVLKDREP